MWDESELDWNSDQDARNEFIFRVYLILSLQLLFMTALIIFVQFLEGAKEFFYDHPLLLFITMIIGFIVYLLIACIQSLRRNSPLNLIMLMIMTICFAVIAAGISAMYDAIIVMYALIMTCSIVIILTFIAKCGSFDFTKCAFFLMVFGILFVVFAIITTFIMIFAPIPILHLIYSCIAVLLFSLYLLFDTQQIIGGGRIELSKDEYILGAIQLFIDIFQIFINMLFIISAICGSRD